MDDVDIELTTSEAEVESTTVGASLDTVEEERLDAESDQAINAVLDDDANRCAVETIDEPVVDDTRKGDDSISKKLGYNRFMIEDVWKVGRERLKKANVKKVRNDARKRQLRKREINKAIAKEINSQDVNTESEFQSEMEVEMPPWTKKMMQLFPDMY